MPTEINPINTIRDSVAEEVEQGFKFSTEGIIDSIKPALKNFAGDISNGFRTATTNVTSAVTDIVGSEIRELTDFVQGALSGLFSIAKGVWGLFSAGTNGLFGMFDDETLQEERKQTATLNDIDDGINSLVKHNKDELKRRARKPEEKEDKGIGFFLIGLLALITGTIAGYLSKALKPFSALGKLMIPFTKEGSIFKLFSKTIPKKLTFLNKIGKMFSNVLGKIGSVFTKVTTMFAKSPAFKLGKLFGSFFFYIRAIWGIFKELTEDSKSIRDRILGISAVLSELFLEIPQMIINGIMKLFNIDYRVDFGKEQIINAVNNITDLVFEYVTKPILDFFLITLPDTWNNFKQTLSSAWNNFKTMVSNLIIDTKDAIQGVFDYIFWPFKKFIIEPLRRLKEWFTGTPDHSVVDAMFESIYNLVQKVFDVITWPFKTFILNPINKLIEWVESSFEEDDESIFDKIMGLMEKVKEIPGKIFDWIRDVIPSPSDILEALPNPLEAGKDLLGKLKFWGKEEEVPKAAAQIPEHERARNIQQGIEYYENKDNLNASQKGELEALKKEADDMGILKQPDTSARDAVSKAEKSKDGKPEEDPLTTIITMLSSIIGLMSGDGKNVEGGAQILNQNNINNSGRRQGGGEKESDNPDQVENFGMLLMNSSAVGYDY